MSDRPEDSLRHDKPTEISTEGNPHAGQVAVTIDERQVQIPYGNVTVVALKEMLGVPPEKDLDELKNNKLHPLNEKGHFQVKGGEAFISHCKAGASS